MNTSPSNLQRILIVKTHALGDLLLLTPALRALKKHYQTAKIDFLTGYWSSEAIKSNPYIDSIISIPDQVFHDPKPLALMRLAWRLRHNDYDFGVIFQPSQFMHWFVRSTGIKHIAAPVSSRCHYPVHYASTWRLNRNRYIVEDFLDVVRTMGISSDGIELDFVVPEGAIQSVATLLHDSHLKKREYVVICPGGGRNPRDWVAQKIWPVENYFQLVGRIQNEGIKVVLAGAESDREQIRSLLGIPNIIDLVGKTSFAELAELLKNARMLITNDSAPMHLALSVRCPFIALFGPSRWRALLPETGRFVVMHADIPCAPCYDNEPFGKCDRFDCIRSIDVNGVYESVMKNWKQWADR